MEARSVVMFDSERRVMAVSPASAALLGLAEADMVGMPCREAFSCPSCAGDACPLRVSLAGDAVEGLLPGTRTGSPLSVSSSPVVAAGGKMALLELRPSEPESAVLGAGLQRVLDGLRTLMGSDVAALACYDEPARQVTWQVLSGSVNPNTAKISLAPGQGFAGRIILTDLPLRTFRFPDDLTGDPVSYPIFAAEGIQSAAGVPVRGEKQVLGVLMIGSRRPRRYTDEDLDRLSRVADSLSLAAEMMTIYAEAIRTERARLAHEVHDGLSQNLFGLKLLLFDLQGQYQAASPAVKKGLEEVCGLLDSTLVDVRHFIADLRRTAQVRRGLVSALSDYLAHFYRLTHLQVELAVRLDPGDEIHCKDRNEALRIVQEALMNVHRHAGASRVRLEVSRSDGAYRISVADDGQGFDPLGVGEGHYGLITMRERAASLGGDVQVVSAPGRGATVTLTLPAT